MCACTPGGVLNGTRPYLAVCATGSGEAQQSSSNVASERQARAVSLRDPCANGCAVVARIRHGAISWVGDAGRGGRAPARERCRIPWSVGLKQWRTHQNQRGSDIYIYIHIEREIYRERGRRFASTTDIQGTRPLRGRAEKSAE